MTTAPFEPNPDPGEERIAAADPGRGAPEPAEGFGPAVSEAEELRQQNPDPDPDEPDIGEG